jgi:hypothetical protein
VPTPGSSAGHAAVSHVKGCGSFVFNLSIQLVQGSIAAMAATIFNSSAGFEVFSESQEGYRSGASLFDAIGANGTIVWEVSDPAVLQNSVQFYRSKAGLLQLHIPLQHP